MKVNLRAVASLMIAAGLTSCVTPEQAAQQAENQLISQCKARGGTYEPLTKSGTQTSPGFIIPTPIGIFGSTGGAQGFASGYCTGPNPAYATACLEQGQEPAPFPATSGCIATDEATRKNLVDFMAAGHAQCDSKGQAVGTATESGGRLQTVCLAR
jgi:hypothetical protein